MSAEAQRKYYIPPEDYLEIERAAEYKSEYLNGEIWAMAGATEAHIVIVGNLVREFGNQIKGRPCRVYSNDMRVQVAATGLYTYPDVVLVCGERRFHDEQRDTLLNPTVIIEVLSPSTADYDRGAKFAHYRQLESLQEYLLAAQEERHVMHYLRQPDQRWLLEEFRGQEDLILLPSINCRLALSEVYENIDLPTTAAQG